MENVVKLFNKLQATYKGKKVFLTGHTGFKGSWMLQLLIMLGANVRGYALAPENEQDLFNLINGSSICDSTIADLRNRDELTKQIIDFQPDFIFHLAAQPLVRLSYQIPSETFEVNAIGTANLLDAVRKLEKKCSVVLITTDKVYHNKEWIYPYRESDELGGYDPYSASKTCTELVINSYRQSFFNSDQYNTHQKGIAVGRAGNVIGGGDWAKDRLIPDICKGLINNETIIIRNPNSVRPWQHVLEPVVAYLVLGLHLSENPLKYSQVYNFGPYTTDALPVSEMVELAINSWGSGQFVIQKADNEPHEAGLLKLDISKAIAELEWKPKMSATQAVEMTIEWYREFAANQHNIREFTKLQILKYLDV